MNNDERQTFNELAARLGEVTVPTYVTIEMVKDDDGNDEFRLLATNAEDQEELVFVLTGMLYEFATGMADYCPGLDGDCEDDE